MNMPGYILEINLASEVGAPTLLHERVEVLPGRGIAGDRKCKENIPDKKNIYERQITFIEIEQINRFNEYYSVEMKPSESRRNVVTKCIDLNQLIGCEFMVGDVRMRGTILCEPCKYLQELTSLPIVEGYLNRGGICAEILTPGYINVGDRIHHEVCTEEVLQ